MDGIETGPQEGTERKKKNNKKIKIFGGKIKVTMNRNECLHVP